MSKINSPDITPEIAAHVLHLYGEGGYSPGSYVEDLVRLIARADFEQRLKFAKLYPGYVTAVTWAKDTGDGVDRLRAILAAAHPGSSVTSETARPGQVLATSDGRLWFVTNHADDGDVAVMLVDTCGDAHPINIVITDLGPLSLEWERRT